MRHSKAEKAVAKLFFTCKNLDFVNDEVRTHYPNWLWARNLVFNAMNEDVFAGDY